MASQHVNKTTKDIKRKEIFVNKTIKITYM